jgi:hypothetical protein
MSDAAPIEIWGIAVLAEKQKAAVEAHCFGDCGKISMGGVINDDMTGGLMVCCEPTCPYMEREWKNYGTTMSFEKPHVVTLRLLRPEESKP